MNNNRIKTRAKELGLSQAKLVLLTGASKGTVSLWFNRPSEITSKFLIPLAKALQCSEEWIRTGKGSPDAAKTDGEQLRIQVDLGLLRTSIEEIEDLIQFREMDVSTYEKAVFISKRYSLGDSASVSDVITIVDHSNGETSGNAAS